jgi:hypothetical protein
VSPSSHRRRWVAGGLLLAAWLPVLLGFHVLGEAREVIHDPFSASLVAERVVAASCGRGFAAHLDAPATVVERQCQACLMAREGVRMVVAASRTLDRLPPTGLVPLAPHRLPSRFTGNPRHPRGPPRA